MVGCDGGQPDDELGQPEATALVLRLVRRCETRRCCGLSNARRRSLCVWDMSDPYSAQVCTACMYLAAVVHY